MVDIASLVKTNGLVVVTSSRFAPGKLQKQYISGTKEFRDGKGKWIITDDMAGKKLKKLVKRFIGNDDEIVYNFKGGKKVIMKISANVDELEINRSNRANNELN